MGPQLSHGLGEIVQARRPGQSEDRNTTDHCGSYGDLRPPPSHSQRNPASIALAVQRLRTLQRREPFDHCLAG